MKIMSNYGLLALTVAGICSGSVLAQNAVPSSTSSLARSSLAATQAAVGARSADPSTEVMIRNRAKVFRDRLTASGKKYWSLTDSDLIGKPPDQVLQRLSPSAIKASDGIREMNIVVDLRKPLTVFAGAGELISLGTAEVEGADLRSISVKSTISTNGVKVVSK